MNTIKSISIVLLALLLFVACSEKGTHNHNHDDEAAHHSEADPSIDFPKEEASAIIAAYLQLKDALVGTDGGAAQQAAGSLVASISSTNEIATKIKAEAGKIAESEDVEAQREAFNTLSQAVYTLAKGTKAFDAPLYKQYCPMAFDNTGAYWLASEKEVNNPYFGDMMLHCGKVQETLK